MCTDHKRKGRPHQQTTNLQQPFRHVATIGAGVATQNTE